MVDCILLVQNLEMPKENQHKFIKETEFLDQSNISKNSRSLLAYHTYLNDLTKDQPIDIKHMIFKERTEEIYGEFLRLIYSDISPK